MISDRAGGLLLRTTSRRIVIWKLIDSAMSSPSAGKWWHVALWSGLASVILCIALWLSPWWWLRGLILVAICVFVVVLRLNPEFFFRRLTGTAVGIAAGSALVPVIRLSAPMPDGSLASFETGGSTLVAVAGFALAGLFGYLEHLRMLEVSRVTDGDRSGGATGSADESKAFFDQPVADVCVASNDRPRDLHHAVSLQIDRIETITDVEAKILSEPLRDAAGQDYFPNGLLLTFSLVNLASRQLAVTAVSIEVLDYAPQISPELAQLYLPTLHTNLELPSTTRESPIMLSAATSTGRRILVIPHRLLLSASGDTQAQHVVSTEIHATPASRGLWKLRLACTVRDFGDSNAETAALYSETFCVFRIG